MQYTDKRNLDEYFKGVAELEQQELEWRKEYFRKKNKEYRARKPIIINNNFITCECGTSILEKNISSHRARAIHHSRLSLKYSS